jgi:branched-chain amino acid transport system ATP-binding protein
VDGTNVKPLVIENLSKSFEGLKAVSNVSFDVEGGERLVIIGPNGAGKTTLFNLITGVHSPTEGKIHLFGEDVTQMPSHGRTHLGMARTFQITNLFPELTLHENILLAVLGTNPRQFVMHRPATSCNDIMVKTERLLAEWNLQENVNTLVRNLSYGVQRQVEVLMALACDAKILLLDEATAGLPPGEIHTLTSMILALDPKITLLIIEHDMNVAFQLAHRMIVLQNGKVIAEGAPEKIKQDPKVQEIYLGGEE